MYHSMCPKLKRIVENKRKKREERKVEIKLSEDERKKESSRYLNNEQKQPLNSFYIFTVINRMRKLRKSSLNSSQNIYAISLCEENSSWWWWKKRGFYKELKEWQNGIKFILTLFESSHLSISQQKKVEWWILKF
jgi:hypothetical protein